MQELLFTEFAIDLPDGNPDLDRELSPEEMAKVLERLNELFCSVRKKVVKVYENNPKEKHFLRFKDRFHSAKIIEMHNRALEMSESIDDTFLEKYILLALAGQFYGVDRSKFEKAFSVGVKQLTVIFRQISDDEFEIVDRDGFLFIALKDLEPIPVYENIESTLRFVDQDARLKCLGNQYLETRENLKLENQSKIQELGLFGDDIEVLDNRDLQGDSEKISFDFNDMIGTFPRNQMCLVPISPEIVLNNIFEQLSSFLSKNGIKNTIDSKGDLFYRLKRDLEKIVTEFKNETEDFDEATQCYLEVIPKNHEEIVDSRGRYPAYSLLAFKIGIDIQPRYKTYGERGIYFMKYGFVLSYSELNDPPVITMRAVTSKMGNRKKIRNKANFNSKGDWYVKTFEGLKLAIPVSA